MKTELRREYENTCSALQQSINFVNGQEFNTIPFEGSWTGAQVTDHIIKSQLLVTGLLHGKTNPTKRDPLQKVQSIKEIFLDFTTKMTAPELILPSEEAMGKEELLGKLKAISDDVITAIQTLDLSETCLEYALPFIGEMTRAEWSYFIIYHTQRHIHQLQNIVNKLLTEEVSC